MTERNDQRPIARIVLAAGLAPTLLLLGGSALLLSWLGELPGRVAVHWGFDGQADGFAAPLEVLLGTVGFGVVGVVSGLGLALWARVPSATRLFCGLGTGTVAFVTALIVLATAGQRGLDDGATSTLDAATIPAAIGIGLVLGLGAAWSIPSWEYEDPYAGSGNSGSRLELATTERVLWVGSVASSRWAIGVSGVAIAGLAVTAVGTGQWWLMTATAVLLVVSAATFSVRVTVDDDGFTVRGLLPWPRVHIPLDQIAAARVVPVRALRDFGGYGYRVGVRGQYAGAKGFVLRSGDALLVERTDGGSEIVVVRGAETAAGLLNALATRATT